MNNNKHIITLNGKSYITCEGLLISAHDKGIASIVVEIIQYPTEINKMTAIASAAVRSKDGKIFSDVGDASPASCSAKIVPHLIRMASTRAKARALRDFTNIGMCSIEELGENEANLKVASPENKQQYKKASYLDS
jgi:hypothetical protein